MTSRSFLRIPRWYPILLALMGGGVACASSLPPRELIDARASYARAASGDAATLNPAALHDAKTALDAAEIAFDDHQDDFVVRDKAYIAVRRAELSEVLAATARAKQDQAQANERVRAEKDAQARIARGELNQAREQLSTTEQRLEQADRSLSTEKQARVDAEKKAREALDRLSVATDLAVKDEPRGTVITVPSGSLFASGKADLLPGAQAKLDAVADALTQEQDHKILIEGHTDSQGSDASNMDLSERRARAVRDYLASRGVPQEIMTSSGLGETRPIADNGTPEGRADNRRVEIIVQAVERR